MSQPSFADFELIEPIQRALTAENYVNPTPIQAAAIPHLLTGRDLLGCAQTGTGKTAAFALPILQRLELNRRAAVSRSPRVLVLAPTRELASQISASFQTYGRHLRFRQATVFGGVGQAPQVRALQHGVHILVATPGRLLDLMQQGHIRLDALEVFVLDEADRMLDMGFLPDIQRIIAHLPAQRQSLFFTATLPDKIAQLADSLLTSPVRVEVTPPSSTVDRINQNVLFVCRSDKRALLGRLLQDNEIQRVLVFTRTKRGADVVVENLERNGVRADAIHGNKSQNARERALDGFRRGRIRVLVATDLAARGLDVDGITHVINYDLPHEPESYVHRIGRTGRAGADGIAYSFCDASEKSMLRAIEKLIQRSITILDDHPFHAAAMAQAPAAAPPRHGGQRRPAQGGRNSSKPGRKPAGPANAAGRKPAKPGAPANGSKPQRRRQRVS